MIIDAHTHYPDDCPLEEKLAECDKLGIEKLCLSAVKPLYQQQGNEEVEQAAQQYPDRIVPLGYVDFRTDGPEKVHWLAGRGFAGLKLIAPPQRYDHEEFFPVYQAAAEHKMTLLFHTGVVAASPRDAEYGISSAYMRPMYLETIARAFPQLTVVGAHLGDPWFGEACEAARWTENVFFDLSGLMYPTLATPQFQTLYWRKETKDFFPQHSVTDLYDKVFWGSDVPVDQIAWILSKFLQLLDALELDQATCEKLLWRNAARAYHIEV